MVEKHLATRFLLQKRQASHIPDHDNPKPLRLARQKSHNSLCGQVCINHAIH